MSRRDVALMVVRRIAVMFGLLLLISFGVFALTYIAPGSPLDVLLGTNPRTPEAVAALNREYNLEEPFLTQYWLWLQGALELQFGNSIQTTLPVTDEIESRLPISVFLGVYAYVLTMVFGVGLGIVTALKRQTVLDRGIVASTVVALSTPAFVAGVILLYFFAIAVPVFPVFGAGEGFVDRLWHLTLPAISLALLGAAYVLKHTRAALINVLDQDYLTFARARGLSATRVLFAYGLRNALIPIVTISGVVLAFLVTGAVLVEVTFSLGGIGELLVKSATSKDIPMLQGVAMVIALIIMLASLLADLGYIAVDPRIRLGGGRR